MDCRARLGAALSALSLAGSLAGCRGAPAEPPDAAPSPQATAEPAPLAPATAGGTAATNTGADGGAVPEPLRSDRGLAPDVPRESPRESGGKESPNLAGYALQAVIRAGEGAGAPKAPEVSAPAIDSARRRTEARMAIDLSQTRGRMILSGGFVLPQGTELRARVDKYGHLVLWPGEETYRVAEPGALRALFGERRLDVAPLSRADVTPNGDGAHRLNVRTRRVDVSTRAAKTTIELGTFREAGDGGVLLCRLLFDLMGAMPPSSAACTTDEIPLHAELRWTTRGALTFDVVSIARRMDLPAPDMAAPPAGSVFVTAPPPPSMGEMLLSKGEVAAFRTGPVDVPPSSMRDAQASPPDSGLLLLNSSDELRVAWLDGVAAAWVAPGGRISLPSPPHGRYILQWRTFLGDSWEAPEPIVVPGTSEVGAARALTL
ncbi:MAG: hypothetical protein ACLP1X_23100 [Polyangiaceae bacterium]